LKKLKGRRKTKKKELTLQVQTILRVVYKKKEKIINQNVTVYDEFLRKSTLRLEQGESNI
jgi:uncharacterized protein YtpQ (UPF0354 family)